LGIKETNNSIAIENFAVTLGINLWRNNRGLFTTQDGKRKYRAGLSINGSSDLIGIMPDGLFLAFEVKQKGKKPSNNQVVFGELVRNNNGIYGWGHSTQCFLNTLCEHYNKSEEEMLLYLKNI